MAWELSLLHWFESIHTPVLDTIMKAITLLGNAGIFWILLTAAFLCFKQTRRCGLAMALSLVFSLIFTNIIIKPFVMRPRPFWIDPSFNLLVTAPTDFSFPSGHSSASFAGAVACLTQDRKKGVILVILAALIAVSRMYLTVHFPTDVLAGTILGIIYGIAGGKLCNIITAHIAARRQAK